MSPLGRPKQGTPGAQKVDGARTRLWPGDAANIEVVLPRCDVVSPKGGRSRPTLGCPRPARGQTNTKYEPIDGQEINKRDELKPERSRAIRERHRCSSLSVPEQAWIHISCPGRSQRGRVRPVVAAVTAIPAFVSSWVCCSNIWTARRVPPELQPCPRWSASRPARRARRKRDVMPLRWHRRLLASSPRRGDFGRGVDRSVHATARPRKHVRR
jgi:hypothetical protein